MNNNETNESEDLNKILQDTTYRLSDIFNELSPGLIVTNSTNTNSAAYSTPINLTTNKLSSASGNTSNNNLKPNSSFNPFPTFSSSLDPHLTINNNIRIIIILVKHFYKQLTQIHRIQILT